jgi:hypothetical protein
VDRLHDLVLHVEDGELGALKVALLDLLGKGAKLELNVSI